MGAPRRGDAPPRAAGRRRRSAGAESIEAILDRCATGIAPDAFYSDCERRAIGYGPAFRGVGELWRRDGEAIGRLTRTECVEAEAGRYVIHPALLDAGSSSWAPRSSGPG